MVVWGSPLFPKSDRAHIILLARLSSTFSPIRLWEVFPKRDRPYAILISRYVLYIQPHAEGVVIVTVVRTERNQFIRIISVRKATRQERETYYDYLAQTT